jgi:hypothetical protein
MDRVYGPDAQHSLVVDGDPPACRRTVAALRLLADTVTATVAFLLHQIRAEGPEGHWAAAYGAQCRLTIDDAEVLEAGLRGVADALAELARQLDAVQALMDRAEGIAAAQSLVVDRHLVPPGGPLPGSVTGVDVVAWGAWTQALQLVRRARRLERDAQEAWARAGHRPAPPRRRREQDLEVCPSPGDDVVIAPRPEPPRPEPPPRPPREPELVLREVHPRGRDEDVSVFLPGLLTSEERGHGRG